MKVLTESNFILYAAANYTNSQCYDIEEFYDDLNRFKYLKKLFSRFKEKGDLKERLILNHIITLYNIFEPQANTRMLFFKTDEQHWYMLKTFLLFLNYMPNAVYHIGEENRIIRNDNLPVDLRIVKALREL
jgi:hypothetical protein